MSIHSSKSALHHFRITAFGASARSVRALGGPESLCAAVDSTAAWSSHQENMEVPIEYPKKI